MVKYENPLMQESKNKIFNHIKIHTQYSICEGAIKIEDLKSFCKENKIKLQVYLIHQIYVDHLNFQKIYQRLVPNQ